MIAETLSNCHHSESIGLELPEHIFRQVISFLLLNIVADDEPVIESRISGPRQITPDVVLGDLDRGGLGMEIVLGVQVEVYNMISCLLEERRTVSVAAGIRGPHVLRKDSEDISECHFVVVDLILHLLRCDLAKVLVTPGMTTDLMAAQVHSTNNCRPPVGRNINLSLKNVITKDRHLPRINTFPRLFPVMKKVALALYESRRSRM
jgi:hypothetical protein